MAFSNQALVLISISALLLSTFAVEAHRAAPQSPSPAPTPSPEMSPNDEKNHVARIVGYKMDTTLIILQEFEDELQKHLDDPKTSSTNKKCIQKCKEIFDSAIVDYFSTTKQLKSGNFKNVKFYISSISTKVDSCKCFDKKIEEELEVRKISDQVKLLNDECLSDLNEFESH